MLSRTTRMASAMVLSACFFGAYAQTPATPAKTPTPQQFTKVTVLDVRAQ